jgi:short subunit dehydrogenase-like uncharacterized protein
LHTVLVIGGYGFFGQRICAALAKCSSICLLIGGRHVGSGGQLARALRIKDGQAVAIDASESALTSALNNLDVHTIIHTAGPFQGQGYTVARGD